MLSVVYWEALPHPRLQPWVEAYAFSTEEDDTVRQQPIRIAPDGSSDLLVSVSATSARADLFGTKTRALLVRSTGPLENLALRFRPGAAARFFRVPASELVDDVADLSALWGRSGGALLRELGSTEGLSARMARLEAALLARLDDPTGDDREGRLVEAATRGLQVSGGRSRIDALCVSLGVGERRLERLFRRRVGIPPKLLARILRFQRAFTELQDGRPACTVALEAGYSDQPHLLRDFRRFAGISPGALGLGG